MLYRTVLVTGAGRRLGREIALELARAGWQVAVHYRGSAHDAVQTVADCATLSGAADAFQANLADEAECRALLPRVIARFGRVDAVVNNASLFEDDSAATFGYDALQRHLCANVGPAVLLAQALQAHLLSREVIAEAAADGPAPQDGPATHLRGVVVNLLDQKLWNLNPDFFSHTLSKAALDAATTMLAQALAPQVRVVSVSPGAVQSGFVSGRGDAFAEQMARTTPLGRIGTPEDVAATVEALATTLRFVTGTRIVVDGGRHL